MDSGGSFTPIETFVSFGRRNKRGNKKAATQSEPSQEPPAPQNIENPASNEENHNVVTQLVTEPLPGSASPSARSVTPISSFGDWDEPFEGSKRTESSSTSTLDPPAPQTQDDGWNQTGDDFFSNLSAKSVTQAIDTPAVDAHRPDPFAFDASAPQNSDFLASLAPASSQQETVDPSQVREVAPPPKKNDPPVIRTSTDQMRIQPPSVSNTAATASSLKVFEFGGDSSELDSFASGWNLPSPAEESFGWTPTPTSEITPAATTSSIGAELVVGSLESQPTLLEKLPSEQTPHEPSPATQPVAAALSASIELPPIGGNSSSRSGGRGRRQTPNFATMTQNGSESAPTQPLKSREPPLPTPQISNPAEPISRAAEQKAQVQLPPVVVSAAPIVAPTPAPEPVAVPSVPLAPPPSVGTDPPPARGAESASGRRAKRSAAERASQMYGATMSLQPAPSTLPIPSTNPIPAVAPVPILPPSHPQPIPVSEPLSPDSSAELFKDAPPRPSWASQVISPAPLTRTPEPPETPQSSRSDGVFNKFGGASEATSDGSDFFGKLAAVASEPQTPPVSHTPEPQPVPSAISHMTLKSPELTNVTLTPVTAPASVAPPPPSRVVQHPVVASSTPVAGINPAQVEHQKTERNDPISYPATPSRPLGLPEYALSTPSAGQKAQSAENAQILILKTAELEATQRQLGRIEREKDDLSRAHDALLQRFRDLETSFHKLQRELRDLKSRNEELSLEADSRRDTEQQLRKDRDELQSQLLVLSQRLRQQTTTADTSSSFVNAQQIATLQRDNEQLRRAVEQLSKANEMLQSRSSGSGASGLMSSSATLATFEQAVAGVKQQYEDRLRMMQKKIETLLVQQQKSELEVEDLRAQKKEAETRAQQLEKFYHDERQALHAKLAALQQRALSAETKLATTVASSFSSGAASIDSQVVDEQRRLLEKMSREHSALEQRCAQLESTLNQVSRDRDMTLASLGDAQQKNSLLLMEKTQLASHLEKLRLDLDAKTRANSADSTQEALRNALADRDSMDQSLKKQSLIMRNLMEENAKLISTVDFYKQVSKESRDVSVIEQLHRDKNILLGTVAELSAEIDELKAAKSMSVVASPVSSVPSPVESATAKIGSVVTSAPPSQPSPKSTLVQAGPSPTEPQVSTVFTPTVDSNIFKPTDLKQSSEFSISAAAPPLMSPASVPTTAVPSRLPVLEMKTTWPAGDVPAASLASPLSTISNGASLAVPSTASAASSIPVTAFPPTTAVATLPVTTSLNGASTFMPPPSRPIATSAVEPPPMASSSNHVEDAQQSSKRRLRHIPFVNTAAQPAAGVPAPSFTPASVNPLPSSASIFVPQTPPVEAGNPLPPAVVSAGSVAPPPKRNSPSTSKRAVASTTGIVPSAFTPIAATTAGTLETETDRVVTGVEELPLMDVDTGSPSFNTPMSGMQTENYDQDGRKGFWGSVWKTVTLQ